MLKIQRMKFSLLQLFLYGAHATFGAYVVYFLTDKGYTNTQIGLIMSVNTLMELLGQPVMGYISDLKESNKLVFISAMAILIIVILPFQLYTFSLVLVAMGMGMFGFLWAPQASILDSWILESPPRIADNYGFIRAFGSIGFALTVVAMGKLTSIYNWNVVFYGFAILAGFCIMVAFYTRDRQVAGTAKGQGQSASDYEESATTPDRENIEANRRRPYILFKNREFVFLLIISVCMFLPSRAVFIYLPTILKSLGGNQSNQGFVLFFTAVSEIPVFIFAKYFLRRYKTRPLLLIAAVFYLLRLIVVIIASSPGYIIIYGALQSLSFAVFLPTARYYVNIVAPDGLKTTAQTLLTMFSFGVGGIIASMLGGLLIDNYGLHTLYYTGMAINITAIVLLIISLVLDRFETDRLYRRFSEEVSIKGGK
ncbi:MAG: MFS transporter [Halanaerobiaceae bacterium]